MMWRMMLICSLQNDQLYIGCRIEGLEFRGILFTGMLVANGESASNVTCIVLNSAVSLQMVWPKTWKNTARKYFCLRFTSAGQGKANWFSLGCIREWQPRNSDTGQDMTRCCSSLPFQTFSDPLGTSLNWINKLKTLHNLDTIVFSCIIVRHGQLWARFLTCQASSINCITSTFTVRPFPEG